MCMYLCLCMHSCMYVRAYTCLYCREFHSSKCFKYMNVNIRICLRFPKESSVSLRSSSLSSETSKISVTTPPWPHDQTSTESILQVFFMKSCLPPSYFFVLITLILSVSVCLSLCMFGCVHVHVMFEIVFILAHFEVHTFDKQHLTAPGPSCNWTLLSQEGAGFPDMHSNTCVVAEAAGVMEAASLLPLVLYGEARVDTTKLESFAFAPEVRLFASLSFFVPTFPLCLSDLCCVSSRWG